VSLLRSRVRRIGNLVIRPARNEDWSEIERALSCADRHYLGLEWWTIQEWLGSPTFLLAIDQNGCVVGLMLAVTSDGPIAWLRAISALSDQCLTLLLGASTRAVQAQGGAGLAFLGNDSWMQSKLRHADFEKVNQVVTLRFRGPGSLFHGPPGLLVREAKPADIDLIVNVDHAAFDPLWWYSREVLCRALNLAHRFDVAYLEGECVGYQLSTLRNGRGHIVRLATHPRWQRQGIGGRLLSTATRALYDAEAESVTVNTQEDNRASLQLYRRFSFERIGRPWAVWFRSLS
jgi:ribosomal-protein-alanine N-acetyltransferase